jgi:hypothetical protein
MLKKFWKSYSKFCGKLFNVDQEKEWEDLKERWKGMRKSPKEFVSLYIEKVKENFVWIKGYKDFPIYKIASGTAVAAIFITSVPEKVINHFDKQKLREQLQMYDYTYEEKLDIIEKYENKKKIQQYGGL